jgi:hypothetical protein
LVLARSPLGTRYEPTFVWDGRELLELGGTASERLGAPPLDSGAIRLCFVRRRCPSSLPVARLRYLD